MLLLWWTKDLCSSCCFHYRQTAGMIKITIVRYLPCLITSRVRRGSFFILVQSLHDLERTATSNLPTVITANVDEKRFPFHVASLETPTSAVVLIPRSLGAASDMLLSATCLDATFIEYDWQSYSFFSLVVAWSRNYTT